MLKLSENPPILAPEEMDFSPQAGAWWVAHTKARAEKAFAWELIEHGVAYFLPMRLRVRFSGGRRRKVLMPLFTSYVFFRGDSKARYAALATDRLCQVIEVKDQKLLADELGAISRLLENDAALELYPHAVVGTRCRVTAGPFEGTEGTVIRRGKETQIVLQVSMLGQGAAMDIDADLLESVS